MYKEESLESMQKEIRENWFENHKVDNIVRDPKGRIVSLTWGELGTDIYRVNYSFVDTTLWLPEILVPLHLIVHGKLLHYPFLMGTLATT